MKQKTRILIYILIAAAVVVLGVLGVLSMRGSSSGDISEHIDLGRKYLIELSYDKAVIEFTEAINIDPNNVDAYLGLAEAYEKIGDIPKAIEWLEKGFAVTGDQQIKEMLDRLRAIVDTESSAVTEGTAVTESETAPPEETTTVTEEVTEMSSEVRVPYLLGMTEERAIKTCESVGLKCEISYAGSDKAEKGCVFGQAIAAGTMVDRGASVPVEVSEGSVINVELAAENLEFDYLAEFEESGWAFAVKGNVGGYVNTEGRFVEVYDDVRIPSYDDKEYYYDGGIDYELLFMINERPYFEDSDQCGPEYEFYINEFKVSEEGLYPICQNSKWGYADINSEKIVIPCEYNKVSYFNCGRGVVTFDDPEFENNGDSMYIPQVNKIITKDSETINITNLYDYFDDADSRIYVSSVNCCYVNDILLCNVYVLGSGGSYSSAVLIDVNGKIIDIDISTVPQSSRNADYIHETVYYTVGGDGKRKVILDENLNKTMPFTDNDEIYIILVCGEYGFYYNGKNMCNGMFDVKGNIIGEFEACKRFQRFRNNDRLFMTYNDTNWYLYNFKGERICDTAFENGWDTSADLIPAKLNGKWGLIDTDGSMVIDFTYDEMYWNTWDSEYSLLCFVAGKEGKNYIVDRDNNVISEVQGEPLYANMIGESNYIVSCMDNKYYIYKIS